MRWGPFLAERQWGTVREDYSDDGSCWDYFPHDHARSRAYRWGEDGLLGVTDRHGRLCFSFALWNERDAFLKERLFGLAGPEGNHGEDVKEEYFYVDALPSAALLRANYKYPRRAFPYDDLVATNAERGRDDPEYELRDTDAFDDGYFDVTATYAKSSPDDILVELQVTNRSQEEAKVHVLPQLWWRNTWSWGCKGEGYWPRGVVRRDGERRMLADGADLQQMELEIDEFQYGDGRELCGSLFTENDTNGARLFGFDDDGAKVKDAFHRRVCESNEAAVCAKGAGSKAAFW